MLVKHDGLIEQKIAGPNATPGINSWLGGIGLADDGFMMKRDQKNLMEHASKDGTNLERLLQSTELNSTF